MSSNISGTTWQENPEDIIVLVNKTRHNYILEMPSGRYRLDAGRRMRTVRTIMKIPQVKELVNAGNLVIEG
jgi:hypothetical protein